MKPSQHTLPTISLYFLRVCPAKNDSCYPLLLPIIPYYLPITPYYPPIAPNYSYYIIT